MLAPTKIYKIIEKENERILAELEPMKEKIREGNSDLTEGQVLQLCAVINPFLVGQAYALGMIALDLALAEMEKAGL